MYNVWFLVIGCAGLIVLTLGAYGIFLLVDKRRKEVARARIREIEAKDWEEKQRRAEAGDLQATREILVYSRPHTKYDNILYREHEGIEIFTGICMVVYITVLMITLLVAILNPLTAKAEYNEFIETKSIVETVIPTGSEYENVAVTQKVIELNQWLAKAKADKITYGNWSMYYALDLDSLEPISLGGQS